MPLTRALTAAFLVCAGNSLLGAADRPALACIQDMALPVYSGPIWQAQITGTATVGIGLDVRGVPSEVRVASPHVALTKWLTEWFKKSLFLPECGGQTITLILKYRLEGPSHEKPENKVVLKYPGTIEFIAYPPILRPSVD
jgi:hypothetical protein